MNNGKKHFLVVLLTVITIMVLVLSSCGKKGDVGDSTSQQTSTSSGGQTLKPQQPSEAFKNLYPSLNAIYNLAVLDGSYNGTNVEIGFPNAVTREDDKFLTYPVGYGEGTTGGRGATSENVYQCATGIEVLTALQTIKQKQSADANVKSIIKITSTITQDNSTVDAQNVLDKDKIFQIVVNSIDNLSIVGVGTVGIFDGVGLNFKSCDNVIVQNLTIHHPSKLLKNEKDCLEFNSCNYVWVDHNELYNDAPQNSAEKDYYDGLCDVKNNSTHVTISYNYIHDAWKTSLVGSGPDDLSDTRTLTYHHNIFKDCNSRLPLIRSGYAHIYNNYYQNIGTGINSRIGAQVYVENNVFDKVKNPICSIEETEGYWNAKNNVYLNKCTGSGLNNASSGTNYTPSYEYVLDGTDNLKQYLDATVGVGKIDVATAEAEPIAYEKYEIAKDKIITRTISEIGEIKFDKTTEQKLIYLSKEVLFADSGVVAKITNLSVLANDIDAYLNLFAASLDAKINAINKEGTFSSEATNLYAILADFNACDELIKAKVTQKTKLNELESQFNNDFVSAFNSEVDSLANAKADKIDSIKKLLALAEKKADLKSSLKISELQNAYISSNNYIQAENFATLVAALPNSEETKLSDSAKVISASNAYKALTKTQAELVSNTNMEKYKSVKAMYDSLVSSSRKLDLSQIAAGRVSQITEAGGLNLGVSVDVKDVSVTNGALTYNKAVYISGYGNAGSKCLQFTIFSDSEITLVLNSENGPARIKLTDENKNEKDSFSTTDTSIQTITFKNLTAGEYRIYTDIPDGTIITDSKLLIYEATILPKV